MYCLSVKVTHGCCEWKDDYTTRNNIVLNI